MNKKINSLLALSLMIVALVITSCSKDDEDEVLSNTALLTNHSWKFGSVTDANPFTQGFMTAFSQNATWTYKADQTYSETSLGGLSTGTGKWEFTDGEKKLVLDKGTADEEIFEIKTLSSGNLDLKFFTTDAGEAYTLKLVK